jgi:tRNA dimethylallyltransferase
MASRSSASDLGGRAAIPELRLPPLVVIAGATATGKTGLAIRVATQLVAGGIPTEIISADSRQVYRGLDIGTAKATLEERAGIPHHGLDLVDPDEPFSLADFAAHARTALAGISERGAIVILVGGTGLYLRAVARGMATEALPADPDVRARIEEKLATEGLDLLVARLMKLAPDRAVAVDARNPRRVVRALEIAELQGDRPLPIPRGYAAPVTWIGLRLDHPTHRGWIANRAAAQFEAGLIDEAGSLRKRYDASLPAFSAIGYREAWSVIDGQARLDEAIAADAARNVAFAKRQRTWFRSEPGIEWLDATDQEAAEAAALARARTLATAAR